MRTVTLTNMTVMVMADNNDQVMDMGQLTQGNILLKTQSEIVLMPQNFKPKRIPENPLLYEGEFFSSRQKRNGNISLHGVINGQTNLCEAHNTARQELEEFFTKLKALV